MKFTSAVAGIKTACIVALSLAIASPSLAQAQNYPNRPIRMIVPFSPGGAADTPGRMLMQKVSEVLGQQVLSTTVPARAARSAPRPSRRRRPTATRCC